MKTVELILVVLLLLPAAATAQEENKVVVTTTDDSEEQMRTDEVQSIRFDGGRVVVTHPWGSTLFDRTLRKLTFLRPLPGKLRLTVSSSIGSQQDLRRALGIDDAGRLKTTWDDGDVVYVYADEHSTVPVGTLIPLAHNLPTSVLIGDVEKLGITTGQTLYLTTKPRPFSFAAQTGRLKDLFNATAQAPVTINGANAEMPSVTFVNPQAVTCFTMKDGYGEEVSVSELTITGGAETVHVTMSEPTSSVYVALPATSEKTTYSFRAVTADNQVRGGTKKANVQDGKYYTADVTMKLIPQVTAPAAKDLHYDGEPQSLVTAATATGGTIMYRHGDGEYSESIPTATEIGDYTVYYKVVGDADCYDVAESSVSASIGRGRGVIRFYNEKVGRVLGSGDFYNVLEMVGDGTVTFDSDNHDVATVVDTSGVVTPWNAGNATIIATVTNGEKYDFEQNTAQYTLKVGSIATNINFLTRRLEKTYGDDAFTNELMNGGDGVVTYSSSSPDVATVNVTTGEVTIIGAGDATITANVTDGRNSVYGTYKSSYNLKVDPAKSVLSTTAAEGECYRGEQVSFNALMNNGYDGALSVKSSDESVATATLENGEVKVHAHKGGSAVIYVTAPETRNWRSDRKIYNLLVNDKSVGSISYELDVDKTYGDGAFTNPLVHVGDGTVSYESSTPGVATVDATGKITIQGVGSTTIKATASEGATYAYPEQHTATYKLTVARGAPAVTAPSARSLTYTGGSQKLVTTGSATGGTIRYMLTSSNSKPTTTSDFSTSIPTATNAGNYYVWYYIQGDGNHKDTEISGPISVNVGRKPLIITAKSQSNTYGTAISTGTGQVTTSGLVSGHSVSSVSLLASTSNATTNGTITPSGVSVLDGGSTDVTNNYSLSYRTGVLTINKAGSSVSSSPTAKSLTYNGSDQALVDAGTASDGTMCYKMTTSNSKPSGTSGFSTTIPTAAYSGNYYVWYYVQGDDNHNDTNISGPVSVSIGRKSLTVTANVQTKTYGTAISTDAGQVSVSGLVNNHSVSAVTLTPSTSNVTSEGTITPSAVTVQDGNSHDVTENYTITYHTGTLIIGKSGSSVASAPTSKSLTYDGSSQSLANAGTATGGTMRYLLTTSNSKPSTTSDFSASVPTATNAGNYYVWYYVQGDDNHSDSEISGPVNVGIGRKSLTITAKSQTKTYGNAISTGTGQVTASGLASNHSVTAVTLTPSTSSATTSGTITPSSAAVQDGSNTDVTSNYTITYHTGALTVNKAAPGQTAPTERNLTYNGGDQKLVNAGTATGGTMYYKMTTSNSKPSSTSGFSTTIPAAASSATYYVWYYVQGDGNHNDSEINGPVSVSVGRKPLTITANAQTKIYGNAISIGSSQIATSGLVNNHSVSDVTLTPSTSNVTTDGIITPSAASVLDGSSHDVTSNYAYTDHQQL